MNKSVWFTQAVARAQADKIPGLRSYIVLLGVLKDTTDPLAGHVYIVHHMGCSVRTADRALRLAVERGDLTRVCKVRGVPKWTLRMA